MRNILLVAKLLAHEEGAAEIQMDHIRGSMNYLRPKESSRYNVFQDLAEANGAYSRKERFSETDIDRASALPKIEYSTEVSQLLNKLAQKGLTTHSELTVIYFDKRIVTGRYKKLLEQAITLKSFLSTKIYDQGIAVEEVSDAIVRMRWGKLEDRPGAIFTFIGPPATGKTYLAKLMGEGMEGYAFRSFDMAQYESNNEGFGLVGLREGYDHARSGDLTTFVKVHPKSVIVFDEIEKAHSAVQSALLQMLSEGFLEDNFSREKVDFRKAIVVFTSNLGSSIYSNPAFSKLYREQPAKARTQLLQTLKKEMKYEQGNSVSAMSAELLSRLSQGSVVLFNPISIKSLARIAKNQIVSDADVFQEKMGIELQLEKLNELCQLFVLMFGPQFDAREIKSQASHLLFDPITDHLASSEGEEIQVISVTIDDQSAELLKSSSLHKMGKQMGMKSQKLLLDPVISEQGNQLNLVFSQARIAKLSSAADHSDASAILLETPEISFNDIAGHHYIKSRLQETVNLLKNRTKLIEYNLSIPKGVLLYGRPGTGKTMLAKAVAHEAGLPFIACTGSDLLSSAFISKLFARAREYSPAIVFIDEIDSLPVRGQAGPAADVIINNLLVELDGFSKKDEVFIIAATNRKDLIDPAIIRSGRIDLHYEVPNLDKEARGWFIDRMLNNALFAYGIESAQILQLTAGFSGADFEKLNREVILSAMREGVDLITVDRIIDHINIIKYGTPVTLAVNDLQLQETAYHEAAHAVVSLILLPERRIEQVTVTARSNAHGMVSFDQEQVLDYTRDFFFGLTCVALAGRVAQMKQFGTLGLDTGAAVDLEMATSIAWQVICTHGMDDNFFNLSLSTLGRYTDNTPFADQINSRVKEWIDQATEKAQLTVEQHWEKISFVAETLLEEETMTHDQLKSILD